MLSPPASRKSTRLDYRQSPPFRNQCWAWSGVLTAIAMMIVGNFLLINASLNSLDLAMTKVKTKTITQRNVEASILNAILQSENEVDIAANATVVDDNVVATIAYTELTNASIIETSNSGQMQSTSHTIYSIPQYNGTNGTKTPSTPIHPHIRAGTNRHTNAEGNTDASTVASKTVGSDLLTADKALPLGTSMPVVHTQAPDKEESSVLRRVPSQLHGQGMQDECFHLHSYGLLDNLSSSASLFCSGNSNDSTYTFYSVPDADFSATQLNNFQLDMRRAQVSHDIYSVAQEGGAHDQGSTTSQTRYSASVMISLMVHQISGDIFSPMFQTKSTWCAILFQWGWPVGH
ncbi:unnamed protein product [Phytophthora fragariaefolia]|uniref:Unnamed protein product n=1 Tax=Phytophthora fragariaefolia TaxID=1490495 RepID=A0A9W7CS74_9STRA|nr:unnamed protein product [Phytophthora fragariaefolia]